MNFENSLSQWQLDELWLENAILAASGKDLVTLDIFDTALTRNVESPPDIFICIEKRLSAENFGAKGFAIAREKAEQWAREKAFKKSGAQEVTFDEIYQMLFEFKSEYRHFLERAKFLELEIEEASLFSVPDILEFTRRLKEKAIPYGFVSDMYLPELFLKNILEKNGYSDFANLVVSSSVKCTKASGDIWRLPCFKGLKILHIGDNIHSDVVTPKKYNIDTRGYRRAKTEIRKGRPLEESVLPFSKARRMSEILLRSNPNIENDETVHAERMYRLGQSFGVLMVGAFTLWLQERTVKNDISHLLFCSRDGYLMQKAWHVMRDENVSHIKDDYIYVSRKVITMSQEFLASSSENLSSSLIKFLSASTYSTTIKDAIDRLELKDKELYKAAKYRFFSLSKKLRHKTNKRKFKDFLNENNSLIYNSLKEHHHNFTSYLKQEKIPEYNNAAIVDMGWGGTMQLGLRKVLRDLNESFSLKGFYYGLWGHATGLRYKTGMMESAFFNDFSSPAEFIKNTQGVDIIEELHSAKEGSVHSFVFLNDRWIPEKKINPEELQQFDMLIAPFQKGVLDGLQEIVDKGESSVGIRYKDLTIENARAAYDLLFLSPSVEEVSTLGRIGHSVLFDHSSTFVANTTKMPWMNRRAFSILSCGGWKIGLLCHWALQGSRGDKKRIRKMLNNRRFSWLGEREKAGVKRICDI